MVGFPATVDVAVSFDVVGKADSERLGGRGLYEDEWLNAGGQVVGIGHPKFQRQYFFGKGRRHNVSAKATRETNIHGVVDGTLEHITLLCFCLCSHRPPDRAEFREMVDLGEVLQRAH